MIKAIKVQLRPNNKQSTQLFQTAGNARWAYNWAIATQEENHKAGGKFLGDCELRKRLTILKQEKSWLYKASNNATKQAVKDACEAYKKFFKQLADKPKFKSKRKSKPAFYSDPIKLKIHSKHAQLEKIGLVKLAEFDRIPTKGKYYNPRISFDGLNWWLSVGVDVQEELPEHYSEPVGTDVGIKNLAVTSDGRVFKNINKTVAVKKANKRLKRLQRQASRQYEKLKKTKERKSKNLIKLEKQILKTHQRLTNIRQNHLHQVTAELVKTKPAKVVIEDLNVKGMMKNRHLSKAIANQKLAEFRRLLQYKCDFAGIKVVVADRWFPSSKTCSVCGLIKSDLKLSDRIFRCECGNEIDRDYQAAINLVKLAA